MFLERSESVLKTPIHNIYRRSEIFPKAILKRWFMDSKGRMKMNSNHLEMNLHQV